MKLKANKRTRIARVRRVQHSLAAAAAVQAESQATILESSAARLAQLRNSLGLGMGSSQGARLANLGELAMRLDAARHGLADAITTARANALHQDQKRLEARQRQESANKLEQRAADALAAYIERKAAEQPRRRARITLGDNR